MMKLFQSQELCLHGSYYNIDFAEGYPSDIYPNSDTYAFHDFYEIEMFTEGSGIHHLNGIDYTVKPGYVYLLYPGDFHYMTLDTSVRFKLWNLKSDISTPDSEIVRFISNFQRPYCLYTGGELFDFLNNEFGILYSHHRRSDWNKLMIKNSINRILITIGNNLSENMMEIPTHNMSLQTILQYMQSNYDKNIKISDIAEMSGKSPNYISIYLKKHTGYGFVKLLTQIRLTYVTNYLNNTALTVKEIADRTGFGSPEYLSRVFHMRYGMSPMEFRNK